MEYEVGKIVQDVRVIMEENMLSAKLDGIEEVNSLSLGEIIKSKIADGVQQTEKAAPLRYLDFSMGDTPDNVTLNWFTDLGEKYAGWIALPDDFMRLLVFGMSDWLMPVHSLMYPEDDGYVMQKSPFKGIGGTVERPVAVLCMRKQDTAGYTQGSRLEFYSCNSQRATVKEFLYLPYPKIENNKIKICEDCYRACLYRIAALSLITRGESELAAAVGQIGDGLLT